MLKHYLISSVNVHQFYYAQLVPVIYTQISPPIPRYLQYYFVYACISAEYIQFHPVTFRYCYVYLHIPPVSSNALVMLEDSSKCVPYIYFDIQCYPAHVNFVKSFNV